MDSELTISILREIRDEIRTTRIDLGTEIGAMKIELKAELGEVKAELAEVKTGVGELSARLDITNSRLAMVEHTVADAATQLVFLARYVKNNHEVAIEDLRARVAKLEIKAGI